MINPDNFINSLDSQIKIFDELKNFKKGDATIILEIEKIDGRKQIKKIEVIRGNAFKRYWSCFTKLFKKGKTYHFASGVVLKDLRGLIHNLTQNYVAFAKLYETDNKNPLTHSLESSKFNELSQKINLLIKGKYFNRKERGKLEAELEALKTVHLIACSHLKILTESKNIKSKKDDSLEIDSFVSSLESIFTEIGKIKNLNIIGSSFVNEAKKDIEDNLNNAKVAERTLDLIQNGQLTQLDIQKLLNALSIKGTNNYHDEDFAVVLQQAERIKKLHDSLIQIKQNWNKKENRALYPVKFIEQGLSFIEICNSLTNFNSDTLNIYLEKIKKEFIDLDFLNKADNTFTKLLDDLNQFEIVREPNSLNTINKKYKTYVNIRTQLKLIQANLSRLKKGQLNRESLVKIEEKIVKVSNHIDQKLGKLRKDQLDFLMKHYSQENNVMSTNLGSIDTIIASLKMKLEELKDEKLQHELNLQKIFYNPDSKSDDLLNLLTFQRGRLTNDQSHLVQAMNAIVQILRPSNMNADDLERRKLEIIELLMSVGIQSPPGVTNIDLLFSIPQETVINLLESIDLQANNRRRLLSETNMRFRNLQAQLDRTLDDHLKQEKKLFQNTRREIRALYNALNVQGEVAKVKQRDFFKHVGFDSKSSTESEQFAKLQFEQLMESTTNANLKEKYLVLLDKFKEGQDQGTVYSTTLGQIIGDLFQERDKLSKNIRKLKKLQKLGVTSLKYEDGKKVLQSYCSRYGLSDSPTRKEIDQKIRTYRDQNDSEALEIFTHEQKIILALKEFVNEKELIAIQLHAFKQKVEGYQVETNVWNDLQRGLNLYLQAANSYHALKTIASNMTEEEKKAKLENAKKNELQLQFERQQRVLADLRNLLQSQTELLNVFAIEEMMKALGQT